MTTIEQDHVRAYWQALARGEERVWQDVGADAEGVEDEPVGSPAGPWLRPPVVTGDEVVLAIHGGGFVSGSTGTHRRMFGHLARIAARPVLVVEYGLVPEHVFPSQLDTVTAAYRWLVDRGASRVAVAGDSCGAMLATALAVRARDERARRPAALLLLSAWTDLEATGSTYDTAHDPFFTRRLVRELAAGYLAGGRADDPLASPLHADLRGLPPTYLQVGADEALLDDSRRLAARLRAAGVQVRLDEFAGQLHTFQMAAGRATVADEAIEEAGSWLRSTLES